MSDRATPFYCPYCGDEDLRPQEEPHAAWLCTGCRRVFTVKFVGLNLTGSTAQREEVTK
ncbi:Insertion element protein [Actinophytocola algeriensis]|uniref:Transposase-like protein n=1 Tax=Actinophytocola algeriensis TaxID=1768010 RepID=A0A7W7Q0N5_9PSEU|nr:Insertion element protein [Actinophytocola algeriensis]MBB4904688.1 transposase-like protein [Actinophytocola algeriensis]MBE1476453.1 transposase-like protein [Actinophytocola algeriensis]